MRKKIKLGDKVKDQLTDLEGTVVAKTVYLHGCTQYEIQPRELKDGKIVESAWIDEPQLTIIEKPKPVRFPSRGINHGGVRNHP